MTIQNRVFLLKTTIKKRKDHIRFAALLLLASSLSFAIGHITGRNDDRAPIIIQKSGLTDTVHSR